MIILGFVAVVVLATVVGKKIYDAYEDDNYDQNTNSCSFIDYEIADRLAYALIVIYKEITIILMVIFSFTFLFLEKNNNY